MQSRQTILSFMQELNAKNKARKEAADTFAAAYLKIIAATTDLTMEEFTKMIDEADAKEAEKSNLTKK